MEKLGMETKRFYCGNCGRVKDHETHERRKFVRVCKQALMKMIKWYCWPGKRLFRMECPKTHEDNVTIHKDYRCSNCGKRTYTVSSYGNRSK